MSDERHDRHVGWVAVLAALEDELRDAQRRTLQLDAIVRDLQRDLTTGEST